VTAEGLVEVNGQIEGDVHCTSLIVSPKAQIVGSITAERVVVNGRSLTPARRLGALVPYLDRRETARACLSVKPLRGLYLTNKNISLALLSKNLARRA